MAKTRRRFASGPGRFYEPQTGCTRGKRIRLAVLEDEEGVYYGEPQMVFCGRTWLHSHRSDQQETEEDLEDNEERESRPKKQKLEQTTDEKREKETAVYYPDDTNMESLLTWLHATDMESCGPIQELAKLKAEGKIESGYKTLEEICAPVISEFDSVYAEINVDVESLYNQESPLQDEIAIPPAESISKRPLSPILDFVDWNREFPDQGWIESDYNTLVEICTAEVDASLNEWLSSLTSSLRDEIAMPQIEIKSKRLVSSAKSGKI